MNQEDLKKLREPFPAEAISKLPKPYKKDSPKGKCNVCGGFHGLPAVHLDYVGHAALTDRLLSVDPLWNWEPLAFDQNGLPLRDSDGGMWIKLTICGLTRLGYGDAQGKKGPDATKEVIGDALRNGAMRFGCALDLWHKGDLPQADGEEQPEKQQQHGAADQKPVPSVLDKWLAWVDAFSKPGATLDSFTAEWDKYSDAIKKLPAADQAKINIAKKEMTTFLMERQQGVVA